MSEREKVLPLKDRPPRKAKIIGIHGGRDPTKPHAELVKDIEELLIEAKRGDLTALAYCTVRSNNDIGSGWVGAAGTKHMISSGISCLAYRYAEALVGRE